jgi:hypothetical protein
MASKNLPDAEMISAGGHADVGLGMRMPIEKFSAAQ